MASKMKLIEEYLNAPARKPRPFRLSQAERAKRKPIWNQRKHERRMAAKQVISAWADKDRVKQYKRAAKKLGLTVAGMILSLLDDKTDEVLFGK